MIEYRFESINPHHTCKAYIFGPEGSKAVSLIDPQLDHLDDYIQIITEQGLKLKYIIDTHTHADHISAASALKHRYNAKIIMGEKAPAKCVDIRVKDQEILDFNGIPMKFITTPGHTKDAISLILPGKIFTGDALFLDEGGAGRDDLPGGNSIDHWNTLQKLLTLPENLIVYPAHDYRGRTPSSLAHQKESNPFLKLKTQEKFVEFLNDLILGPADWMKDVLKANYSCTQDPKAAWVPLDSPSCEVMGTIDPSLEKFQVNSISPETLDQKIRFPEKNVLIDVRSKKELEGKIGRLKEAVHIPLSSIMNDVSQLNPFKEKQIITICGSGKRAKIAAKMIKKSGFQDPVFVEGGIKKWKEII